MTSNDFVSVNKIVSDIATSVNDEEFLKLDKGFYISCVHDAVTHFAIHTFYQKVVEDIFDWNDGSDTLSFPQNAFNLKQIYLHNTSRECIADGLSDYVVVHWKRNLVRGSAGIKTSRIKESNNFDPVLGYGQYMKELYRNQFDTTNLYYAGIQGGEIIFSDSCRNFSNVRLVYNGMGAKQGELPCIPRILEEGIKDWAQLSILAALKSRDNEYRYDYRDLERKIHGGYGRFDIGSYQRCKNIISKMDKFVKDSIREYLSNADTL